MSGTLSERRLLHVHEGLFKRNDVQAARNREKFRERGIRAVNLLSAPGAGKTAVLERTIRELAPLRAGVIVGDLATDNDARRIRATGAPAEQITTGTICHLDAAMVASAIARLGIDGLDILFLENVGNLVCPASYDLGENLRVVVLSVTEGEDKPLKYPVVYRNAGVALINKMDLADAVGFDREAAHANILRVAPEARILEISAKTGEGFRPWLDCLASLTK
ncbi:MAG: hydrogenase nickel incorporation protein HypB [Planctomycetota bacterium]